MITAGRVRGLRWRSTLDIRRGGLGKTKLGSFFDFSNARLIRKTKRGGDRSPTLYIVAVSKGDQAVEIIRGKAADDGDEVEDLAASPVPWCRRSTSLRVNSSALTPTTSHKGTKSRGTL